MEKISWVDRVRHEEVVQSQQEGNILYTIYKKEG